MARHPNSQTAKLGQNIRKRRKALGLTQEELSEKLGLGHQALSRIEQGATAPKMDRLPRLAAALHCTVADLFQESPNAGFAARIDDLFTGLSPRKQEFIFQHIASLVFLLKLDE